MKRYRKDLEKDREKGLLSSTTKYTYTDFLPTTYTLPGDYNLFAEEFRKNPSSVWIMKPTDKARGVGIFIINRLQQIRKWSRDNKMQWSYANCKDTYVVSRYIENPLLIGGKKFDLSVLVTSWKPLTAYKYTQGFARFCSVKYTSDTDDLSNNFMHLTNVSIQKYGDSYNHQTSLKFSYRNLLLYLSSTLGHHAVSLLQIRIDSIILHSLRSVQQQMSNDKHCFECYGYDIIVDDELRPWLIEVNASPSLSATSAGDRGLKHALIDDILKIVIPEDFPEIKGAKSGVANDKDKKNIGDFVLLVDDIQLPERPKSARNGRGA
ncbi:putative tubulin polyglutamylase ttll1 [Rhizophlyctis rosea]|uniref:Tubulin polyglutamylase ttll1 n=1 Tax=Rhizophlyctis rosea TaxID=64517 RepID=A0AAD5X1F0_9FUNG|nr:putative tubulin polyglutamylase ttll1 [Rhizophlyctis rosea]